MKIKWKRVLFLAGTIVLIIMIVFVLQKYVAHNEMIFTPDYDVVQLTENTDYETFFRQTGLGESIVKRWLEKDRLEELQKVQEKFFLNPRTECVPLLGWFTMEDRLTDVTYTLMDLQPGDILVTVSTHSLGWRHGHAALVIDEDTTLECVTWGEDSMLCDTDNWKNYSNCAVLRIKDVTTQQQQQVVEYALENLQGIPYHLSAGFIGEKAPEPKDRSFGLQCAYLVWYAWYQMGYDLDSDGGRLVSSYDLLGSELLEVVQIYGMDPRKFLKE